MNDDIAALILGSLPCDENAEIHIDNTLVVVLC